MPCPDAPCSVALLYHGEYLRGTVDEPAGYDWTGSPKCSDFFVAAANHHDQLVAPLRARGARLQTFFHTVRSGCASRDQALVNFLQPLAHRFDDELPPRIVDSFISVIDLLLASSVHVDVALLVRFDAMYKQPLDAMDIRWPAVNFAFADTRFAEGIVSDLFHVCPGHDLPALRAAFAQSGERAQEWPGSAHYAWEPLREALGEERVHFIDEGLHTSTQNAFDVSRHTCHTCKMPSTRMVSVCVCALSHCLIECVCVCICCAVR